MADTLAGNSTRCWLEVDNTLDLLLAGMQASRQFCLGDALREHFIEQQDHVTKIDTIEAAFLALGRRLELTVA
ncbi:hypothetical protein [Cupriavidus consociatus]|uniref:hypothetical protein n=1 Tax=Cupriavidus consociatus TaxID=2821357 RepID=UPI003D73B6DE